MNKRNTIQKKLVLDAVRALGNHATAEEIYNKVVVDHSTISKGTVYRNLSVLAEEGQILKVDVPEEAARYDHTCIKHYHVKCETCGGVYDVDMDVIPNLIERIKDSHGFQFLDYDIVFRGICPECQNNEGGKSK